MATRVGGPISDSYGLSLTVKCPTASEANPIKKGMPLSWSGSQAYAAVPAAAGAVPALEAKHDVSDPFMPLGVYVFSASRVAIYEYTGTAPALGASVEADGTGGMRAAAAANGTRVLYVDTAKSIIEVLMP